MLAMLIPALSEAVSTLSEAYELRNADVVGSCQNFQCGLQTMCGKLLELPIQAFNTSFVFVFTLFPFL